MRRLSLQRSALVCLFSYLVGAICASPRRGHDHGILSHQRHHRHPRKYKNTLEGRNILRLPYQWNHQSSKAHLYKHPLIKSPRREDFFLDRRDFVPRQLINVPVEKKQNIFENQGFSQMGDEEGITSTKERNFNDGTIDINGVNMKSNGARARKINANDLGYRDLKRVEDADESVNEVINSIINDDRNLEKAMSDETGYGKPTRSPSEDFDVAIEENTAKASGGSSYVPAKWTPKVEENAGQKEASHVAIMGSDPSSDGKPNETKFAQSWSVQLESASSTDHIQDGSQGNNSGSHSNGRDTKPSYEEAYGNSISNEIGNTILHFSQGGTGKEYNDSNAYSQVGNKVDDNFKLNLNASGSLLPGGKNKKGRTYNDSSIISDIFSTKMLNFTQEDTGYISKNNSAIDNTKLGDHGDEVTNNDRSQNFSSMIHSPGVKDDSNINSIITNVISGLQIENSPISAQSDDAVLGNTTDENSTRNSSSTISKNITNNRTKFANEEDVDSGSHGSVHVNVATGNDNDNGSISNNGDANVEIVGNMANKDDQNGHLDNSNNSSVFIEHDTTNIPGPNGKDTNDTSDYGNHQGASATPSTFLKQHPNAFKILMEYFRKEASLQQKLRDRLNTLRKTKITDENAMKKSFASVHEFETMPTRPLPLRDFVADLFKFAAENVPAKGNPENGLKIKASKQGFLIEKGKLTAQGKPGRKRQPIVEGPRKIVGKLHNSAEAPKQSLPSRKADVTFLADFENVTEVAKEINGNISKIFQDAVNSNNQSTVSSVPSASSALGLAEERIGKIIAQNEIPQNLVESEKSNAVNKKGYATLVNGMNVPLEGNAILVETKGPDRSKAIKVEAIGPVESNTMPNTATGPIMNFSKAISNFKEASYGIGQTSPSEALYDFIHTKNMDSKTMMYKKGLKSLEVSLSQDFFNFWMYHYRSFEEMSIKPEQLRSGIATVGSTNRLERVIKKALKGERINVLIVGGSISAGGGLERDRHDLHGIYYKAFVEWWNNTVTPITTSNLKLNVVAIGGTDSEYFSYCIKNYIHDQPDLVIWELAANDYHRYAGREMDPAKPLEQLTRLLLTLPSQPALIFINFFRGDYYKTTLRQDCPDSEDEGGRIMAEYYKITSLSWRNIICSQMKLPDMRSSNGAKREYTPLTLKTLFSSDGYHPSLLGHAQCATLLISYVRSVFEEVVSREISRLDAGKADDNTAPDKTNLPNAIYGDPVAPNPMCWTLLTSDFHHPIENQLPGMRIMEANGFEFTNITRWPVRMDRLRCLKALHSDASLRIKFDVLREANDKVSTQRDVAVISHNSFSGSARVWLDNDRDNAVMIEEPSGQRRTQANIIKRVLQPGSHVINIRSIAPGFCVSALAIL